MISYIVLDDTRIEFIGGKPPRLKRQKRRQLKEGFAYQETITLDDMKRRNFLYVISPFYAFIKKQIPDTYLSLDLFVGLAWFFSIQLDQKISREFYRRLNTCIFWLQMRFTDIKQYIQQHRIIINYNNHEYNIEYSYE